MSSKSNVLDQSQEQSADSFSIKEQRLQALQSFQ